MTSDHFNLHTYQDFWIRKQGLQNPYLEHDKKTVLLMEDLLSNHHPECWRRDFFTPGHITGSALIIDPTFQKHLLAHHLKLDKWLQLGGHGEGETNPFEISRRESIEESGLTDIKTFNWHELMGEGRGCVPLDLDIHRIPARKSDPEHFHFDFRYIFMTGKPESILCSEESQALQWFDLDKTDSLIQDASVIRLIEKAKMIKSWMEEQKFDLMDKPTFSENTV